MTIKEKIDRTFGVCYKPYYSECYTDSPIRGIICDCGENFCFKSEEQAINYVNSHKDDILNKANLIKSLFKQIDLTTEKNDMSLSIETNGDEVGIWLSFTLNQIECELFIESNMTTSGS